MPNFFFFFDSEESPPVGPFDEELAYQFETWIRISCTPRSRLKKDGGTIQESRQGGTVEFHRGGKMSFEVVAYYLRHSFGDGSIWYLVLVRFLDGVYQKINIDMRQNRDEQSVSIHESFYSRTIERRLVFRSEEYRQEYRKLPTL